MERGRREGGASKDMEIKMRLIFVFFSPMLIDCTQMSDLIGNWAEGRLARQIWPIFRVVLNIRLAFDTIYKLIIVIHNGLIEHSLCARHCPLHLMHMDIDSFNPQNSLGCYNHRLFAAEKTGTKKLSDLPEMV